MQYVKKAAEHTGAVVKRVLFIGFSIQIVLGLVWMGCNFMKVQDFGEADSALYRGLFGLFGGIPCILYFMQLAAAFLVGYFLLREMFRKLCSGAVPMETAFTVWGSLALLTFPFAMQCHLAILPYSFESSLFLLVLLFLLKVSRKKGWKKCLQSLGWAAVCIALMAMLSGVLDADKQDRPGRSLEGALASRIAWPTLWVDFDRWTDDLQEIAGDMVWEVHYYPDNMKMLQKAIEEQAGIEKAKEYYRQMIRISWGYHASMVVRQIGWDVLGYIATPVISQLQLEGEAYDSYTGRNYEIMRGNAPVLTRYYVEYACWWFRCSLALSFVAVIAHMVLWSDRMKCIKGKGFFISVGICAFLSGILTALLTMRGAGMMDYKCTVAVNELWLAWILLLMRMPSSWFGEKQDDKGKM